MINYNYSDINDMSDKEIKELYNSFETDETKEDLNKRYKEHENHEEPINESVEDIKNSEPKKQEEVPEEFLRTFEEEATKDSKEKSEKITEKLEKENEESVYLIPAGLKEKGYFYDESGIYCPLEGEYYLKMWREKPASPNSKKNFCYAFYDKENKVLHQSVYNYEKGIYDYVPDEDKNDKKTFSKQLNRKLGYQTSNFIEWNRLGREDGKGFVTDNLREISKDFINLMKKGIVVSALTADFDLELLNKKEDEEKEEIKQTKKFEDYPPQIQKDALELLENGDVLNNIKLTTQLKHSGDDKLIEVLVLVNGTLYSGTPVQTIVGGETGIGKTDVTQAIIENYPNDHVFYFRTLSPKYIYYDREIFNEDYNILIFDDVNLSNQSNIEMLKELTDNKKKIKELRTVIDGKAVTFTLTGTFIVILTYAKNIPDLELSNRLFNTGIITDDDQKENVKHKIKSNSLIDVDNNLLVQQLQETNKCAITKLVEDEYEILNPYLFFINPEQLNNRDITAFINLVNASTFYNSYNRCILQIGNKKIKIGTKKDINRVLKLWDSKTQKYKLNTRQQQILNLPLPEFTLEEAMEYQQKIINDYNTLDSAGFKEKMKKEQWSRERIAREINANINTIKFDIDINKQNTTCNTLYSLGLIERYRFDENEHNSMFVYYKPKNVDKGLKSELSNGYIGTFEMYQSNLSLYQKISLIINLMYRYNFLINDRVYMYIKKYCSESSEVVNDDSMFCFLQDFFNSGVELIPKNENTSVFEIVKMYELIKHHLNDFYNYEQKKDKNNIYIHTSPKTNKIVPTKKPTNTALNQNPISNHSVHLKNNKCTNNEIRNKAHFVDFDLEDLNNNNNNCKVSNNDVNELIQNYLESNPKGLTYKKIVEVILEYFDLSPDSEENDHIVLKIEKVLDDLIKSNIIFKGSDRFNQVYILKQ